MVEPGWIDLFRRNERLTTLVNHLIVSLMLACFLAVLAAGGRYLIPTWENGYLPWLGFFVALEAMYSKRAVKGKTVFEREWFAFRGAEAVVILLAIKLLLYALRGFDQLPGDLALWRTNFLGTFFSGEYGLAVGLAALVWVAASLYSEQLAVMEGDEKLLGMERETGIMAERPAARRDMISISLGLGTVMTVLAGFLYLDRQSRGALDGAPPHGFVALVVYFLLCLLLLSLTQFSVLRARWVVEGLPISANLASRWLTYSLVFLVVVSLAAAVLPTRYSLGLLDVLRYLLALVSTLFSLILYLLSLPLLGLAWLVSRFSNNQTYIEPPQLAPPILPPAEPTAGGPSWFELARSLLFWGVFLAVIVFSLVHYLQGRRDVLEALRRFPLVGWLASAWHWLQAALRGANRTLTAAVQEGLRRLRLRPADAAGRWGYVNPRRLSPRQQVLFYYLALIRRGSEQGLPRRPDETPLEYARTLEQNLPEVAGDVAEMTYEFDEARYSRHAITPAQAGLARRAWEQVRRVLRRPSQSERAARTARKER